MSTDRGHAAYLTACRYCHTEIMMARTITGHWQAFDTAVCPPGPGVHRYRRGVGMVEADAIPGYRVHYCVERAHVRVTRDVIRHPDSRSHVTTTRVG